MAGGKPAGGPVVTAGGTVVVVPLLPGAVEMQPAADRMAASRRTIHIPGTWAGYLMAGHACL